MWSFYVNYLFIEFTENVLYRDIYRYRDMNDLYRDMIFWSYRQALVLPGVCTTACMFFSCSC